MSKIKLEIKSRWTDSVLFEYEKEDNTLKDVAEKAVEEGAYLGGAYLEGANLRGANLGGAYLEGANLGDANLGGANLEGAYIYLSDNVIDTIGILKDFEEKNNIKITETYINKNVIPTRWNCFWGYGLIICSYKTVKKEEIEEMTLTQVCKELGRNIKIIKED